MGLVLTNKTLNGINRKMDGLQLCPATTFLQVLAAPLLFSNYSSFAQFNRISPWVRSKTSHRTATFAQIRFHRWSPQRSIRREDRPQLEARQQEVASCLQGLSLSGPPQEPLGRDGLGTKLPAPLETRAGYSKSIGTYRQWAEIVNSVIPAPRRHLRNAK